MSPGILNRRSTLKPRSAAADIRASENFTQTINELEHLLNEALYIARLAAEKDTIHKPPGVTGSALGISRQDDESFTTQAVRKSTSESNTITSALYSRPLNIPLSMESVHESLRSYSEYSSSSDDVITRDTHEMTPNTPSSQKVLGIYNNHENLPQTVATLPTLIEDDQFLAGLPRSSSVFQKADMEDISLITVQEPSHDLEIQLPLQNEHTIPSNMQKYPNHGSTALRGVREAITVSPSISPTSHNHNMKGLANQQRGPIKQGQGTSVLAPPITDKVKPYDHFEGEQQGDQPERIQPTVGRLRKNREVREFIRVFHHPPIEPRASSLALRKIDTSEQLPEVSSTGTDIGPRFPYSHTLGSQLSLDGPLETETEIDFSTPHGVTTHAHGYEDGERYALEDNIMGEQNLPRRHISGHRLRGHVGRNVFSLHGRHHVSIDHQQGFSLSTSHKRQPIARDWSPIRKRFVAAVACISTALIGILIGIYAGEVPSIQYYIADFHHYSILGNVFMFVGLAISTFFCWPLPLLHGRKPYILGAMTIAMPLLFPQAIAVSEQRSPYTNIYRMGLILPRAFMGFALGFANMNFMSTLTDLFGASLQSGNPHQEVVDEYDVRRHGGGLGVWLGIWTWCYMGSIGVGFLIGAWIINTLSPDWGFYVSIIIIAAVLFLNVVTPEVRRSPYRRSVAEVRNGGDVSRRLARGEVMMHRLQTGPRWWGEEFHQGVLLSCNMLRQPGFLFLALYVAWIYGQIVLIIVLLGSLMSKYYHFVSPHVGLTTLAIPIGAMLAIPFQKASLFSRARHHPQRTDSMTFERRVTWSSHLIRRAIFTLVLPFAGLAYTLSSGGPPTPFILPILFAGLIGFLSNLAIAECNGIIMEAFDTSDLQPGMTGRPRGKSGEATRHKRTNYSSFPRVSSAFSIIQSLGFLIAAAATGVGGVAQRHLGQQAATGVMAGMLLVLTVGVLAVLIRWKEVQIIPSSRTGDMARWERQRKESVLAAKGKSVQPGTNTTTPSHILGGDDEAWRPVIIGNPSGKTRRMSILELGHLSRWSEIKRRNRLVDERGYEGQHPNLAVVASVRDKVIERSPGSLRMKRLRKNKDEGSLTESAED